VIVVEASDNEDQSGCGEQRQQSRLRSRRDLVAKQHGVDLSLSIRRVGFGVRLSHRCVNRAKLGVRLLECGAGSEAAEESAMR
jgi:hypothetical protein